MKYFVTLTYPPVSPAGTQPEIQIKRDLDKVQRWLIRRGCAGVWTLEFTQAGTPHFALLVRGTLDADAIRSYWHRVAGQKNEQHRLHGVYCEQIRNQEAAAKYLCKQAGDVQKRVPEGYGGRMYGTFGGIRVEINTPQAEQTGDAATVAPLVRFVRRLINARRRAAGQAPVRDNGRASFVAWDCAAPVERFMRWYGGNPPPESGACGIPVGREPRTLPPAPSRSWKPATKKAPTIENL